MRRGLIEPGGNAPSVSRQCARVGLSRSSYSYEPAPESPENLALMRLIDREYMRHPFLGSRRMASYLRGAGHRVNRKRVRRLMARMGLEAVYQKPRLSTPGPGHRRIRDVRRACARWVSSSARTSSARGRRPR